MIAWHRFLDLVQEEVGSDGAARIEQRACAEMAGTRLLISPSPRVTKQMIENTAPGKPRKAAQKLGISPSTAYRIISRKPIVR